MAIFTRNDQTQLELLLMLKRFFLDICDLTFHDQQAPPLAVVQADEPLRFRIVFQGDRVNIAKICSRFGYIEESVTAPMLENTGAVPAGGGGGGGGWTPPFALKTYPNIRLGAGNAGGGGDSIGFTLPEASKKVNPVARVVLTTVYDAAESRTQYAQGLITIEVEVPALELTLNAFPVRDGARYMDLADWISAMHEEIHRLTEKKNTAQAFLG